MVVLRELLCLFEIILRATSLSHIDAVHLRKNKQQRREEKEKETETEKERETCSMNEQRESEKRIRAICRRTLS